VSRPRLLDLFCGAGGCGMGYYLAGFDVTGVDIENQPNYPFEFHQADAMTFALDDFDAVHASPPCQGYSKAMKHLSKPTAMLIDATRDLLVGSGLPYVIENVVGAPVASQPTLGGAQGVILCGTMFGLRIRRHRLFETSFGVPQPSCGDHSRCLNPHNQAGRDRLYEELGKQHPDPVWNGAMGVGWMGKYEGREAIPPAYTQYLGWHLLNVIRSGRRAA
jgi:DNA (cytosine-5)-methyltransferase 1